MFYTAEGLLKKKQLRSALIIIYEDDHILLFLQISYLVLQFMHKQLK